jgi:hypothetical protein
VRPANYHARPELPETWRGRQSPAVRTREFRDERPRGPPCGFKSLARGTQYSQLGAHPLHSLSGRKCPGLIELADTADRTGGVAVLVVESHGPFQKVRTVLGALHDRRCMRIDGTGGARQLIGELVEAFDVRVWELGQSAEVSGPIRCSAAGADREPFDGIDGRRTLADEPSPDLV